MQYARLIENVSRGRADVYDAVILETTTDEFKIIAIDHDDDDGFFQGTVPRSDYIFESRTKDDILRRFKETMLDSAESLNEAKNKVKRKQWDLERNQERFDLVFKGET